MLMRGRYAGDAGAELRRRRVRNLDRAVDWSSLGQLEVELQPISNSTSDVRADLKSFFRQVEHFAGNNLRPSTDLAIPFDRNSEEFPLLRHVVSDLSYVRLMIYPSTTERNEEERVLPKYSRPSIASRTSALKQRQAARV